MDCGGKREHGRDAALMQGDFRRLGICKRLCKVESGVALRLPPHSIKEAPKKVSASAFTAAAGFGPLPAAH